MVSTGRNILHPEHIEGERREHTAHDGIELADQVRSAALHGLAMITETCRGFYATIWFAPVGPTNLLSAIAHAARPPGPSGQFTFGFIAVYDGFKFGAKYREEALEFGYFTLSDNQYPGNRRSPNQLVGEIVEQALLAEKLGMHSAWIGEHHFSTLGVNSSPELVLTYLAAQTKHIRLAPAVTVLPLHHPIRVAEQWATLDLLSKGRVDFAAGRGYDRREYGPFGADFENNASIFAEGMEILQRLWAKDEHMSWKGRHYQFDDVWITPRPVQTKMPMYIASFSRPSIELAARLNMGLVVAAGAASGMHGSLAGAANIYRDACAQANQPEGRLITSYFIHFADTPEQERAARERQLSYHKDCTSHALPGDKSNAPANYHYFEKIVNRYQTMKPEDFTDSAVLIGNSAKIIEILKEKVEAAGFDEVILYFSLGLKPHAQVKDEMARFMAEVAPHFEGSHRQRHAA